MKPKLICLLFCIFSALLFTNANAKTYVSHQKTEYIAKRALECINNSNPKPNLNSQFDFHQEFQGCYDWHTSILAYIIIANLYHLDSSFDDKALSKQIIAELKKSINPQNIAKEIEYINSKDSNILDRPHELAYILTLDGELNHSSDNEIKKLNAIYKPLTGAAHEKVTLWLQTLNNPNKNDQAQTAHTLYLLHQWAYYSMNGKIQNIIEEKAMALYSKQTKCQLNLETNSKNLQNTCFEIASLMANIMPYQKFQVWLPKFLPQIPNFTSQIWIEPVESNLSTPINTKYTDTLNIIRANKLNIIASFLWRGNVGRRNSLYEAAKKHETAVFRNFWEQESDGNLWPYIFALNHINEDGMYVEIITVCCSRSEE